MPPLTGPISESNCYLIVGLLSCKAPAAGTGGCHFQVNAPPPFFARRPPSSLFFEIWIESRFGAGEAWIR